MDVVLRDRPVRGARRTLRHAVLRAVAVSRPLFWLNSAALCVVAAILAPEPPGLRAAVLIVFAGFPLNLFIYGVNDLFDVESDRANPRKGSAEGARFEASELSSLVPLIVLLNLPFVAFLLATAASGRSAAASVLAALVAIYAAGWAYSAPPLRLKARPGWDSLANAAYVLPLVLGCAYLGVEDPPWLEIAAFAAWAVGSHALTSVQDVDVDRAAGLRTIATELGARRCAAIALAADLLAAALIAPAHPAFAPLPLVYAAIAGVVLVAGRAAAHGAYRAFMAANLAAGFAVVTAIALAHPERTAWAAAAMLVLCAAVAAAVALCRPARSGAEP